MLDAKSLLLINDQQSQVIELNVFAEQPVRADYDVNLAILEASFGFFKLFRRSKARHHSDLNRKAFKAALHRIIMLLGQNRGWNQKGHLLAA